MGIIKLDGVSSSLEIFSGSPDFMEETKSPQGSGCLAAAGMSGSR